MNIPSEYESYAVGWFISHGPDIGQSAHVTESGADVTESRAPRPRSEDLRQGDFLTARRHILMSSVFLNQRF